MKKFLIALLFVVAVVSLVGNFLLYQRWSNNRPLVLLGNDVVRKREYQEALDDRDGKTILTKLVFTKLVASAATKDGLYPTSKDVDQRIAEIQRRNPQIIANALADPKAMEELRRSLITDMALENLRIKNVAVTDTEVNDFYHKNLPALTLPATVKPTVVITANTIDAEKAAGLLQSGTAAPQIAQQPRMKVVGQNGVTINMQSLPPADRKTIQGTLASLKQGQVKQLSVGGAYVLIRADKVEAKTVPTLDQMKSQITHLLKLQKAPTVPEELATLYQQAKPQFTVQKYASYFSDVQEFDINKAVAARKVASTR